MKVVNLDKITTRREKVIVLGGVEHVMRIPTVKDYIEQMKKAEEITALNEQSENPDTVFKMMQITIETLMQSFPTITKEQFEALNMDQLTALRELVEDEVETPTDGTPKEGEAAGEQG